MKDENKNRINSRMIEVTETTYMMLECMNDIEDIWTKITVSLYDFWGDKEGDERMKSNFREHIIGLRDAIENEMFKMISLNLGNNEFKGL